ncbi:hypothetical protein H4687_000296 [Streptomyces stelliscabiei]|uniref:Uncharacterized protein n=1 Tax=Streptomyces stelliscabiei TaxID=146820 RepID=A0A8I0NZN3_9ACTN|nr:hypothetical protein [Streptomyces stelliscabiei]
MMIASEASVAISRRFRQVAPSSRHHRAVGRLCPRSVSNRLPRPQRKPWLPVCGIVSERPWRHTSGNSDRRAQGPFRRPDFPAHRTSLDAFFALYLLSAPPDSPVRTVCTVARRLAAHLLGPRTRSSGCCPGQRHPEEQAVQSGCRPLWSTRPPVQCLGFPCKSGDSEFLRRRRRRRSVSFGALESR